MFISHADAELFAVNFGHGPATLVAHGGWAGSWELWAAAQWLAGAMPNAHHGRWTLPVIPTTQPNIPHNWFVTAQKTA